MDRVRCERCLVVRVGRPLGAAGCRAAMSVIDWLLDGDPAIRWQVLGDLTNASPDDVAAERAQVEHDGWGAHLPALEDPDGLWAGGACFPASCTAVNRGSPGRRRCTCCRPCNCLGSTRRRSPPDEGSRSLLRAGAGSTLGSDTSKVSSGRASTVGRSRAGRTR